MEHYLSPELTRRPVRVLIVGCGGNGSAITAGLPYLHQAMLVHGHPGGLEVTLMDGDVVSPTNCVRQPFSQAEIGHSKAVVLVSRMNLFWGLKWHAVADHFSAKTSVDRVDILIGCVDRIVALVSVVAESRTTKIVRILGCCPVPNPIADPEESDRSWQRLSPCRRRRPASI